MGFMDLYPYRRVIRRFLNQERSDALLNDKKIAWKEVQASASGTFTAQVPALVVGQRKIFVKVDQVPVPTKNKQGSERFFAVIDFGFCSESFEACSAEVDARTHEGQGLLLLPPGVSIQRFFFGDAGRDGDTDVLLKLSNGAAILLENRLSDARGAAPRRAPSG